MFVSSYQMHNVLKVYSRQLMQNQLRGKRKTAAASSSPIPGIQAGPGKRLSTMEKVSRDILNKITRSYGPRQEAKCRDGASGKDENSHPAAGLRTATSFVFNVIDGINTKKIRSLPVDDSAVLIRRLEQLSKQTANPKQGSRV